MKDEAKTKEQLTGELAELRQRVAELEASEAGRKRAEEALQKARDELEMRVEERTADLAKANEELRNEIAERKRVEEALREGEERFRTVFEEGPLGMGILSPDDRFVRANARLCQIVKYTEEELSGLTFYDITHPDDIETSRQLAQQLLNDEAPFIQTEKRYIAKDGQIRWINLTASFLRDDEGIPLYKLTMVEDVTERKQAEEALRESEVLIRGIVEHTPLGVIYLEADGTIVYANPASRRMVDLPKDSLSPVIGKRIQDLPPIQEANVVPIVERLLQGETVAGERVHYRSLMGVELDAELHAAPRLDSRGDVVGAVVMWVNVTRQMEAEAALRQSEERYRTLVAQAPIGIATCDRQGNLTSLNPAILQRIGSSGEEDIRRFNLLTVPSLVEAGVSDDFRRCMEEDTLVVSERLLRFQRSGEMMMRLRLVPLKDEKGEVSGTLATVEDVGEQRKLEAQLRQAQKLEAVGTLAGGIAHEFNNLLTGIIGNLSLAMIEVEPGSQAYQDLQGVERSARRATALTRQLLTLSHKPRAEQLKRLNLNPVVGEVAGLLHQTIDRRIEIDTYLAADLWPVEADPNQVHQMLVNLCLNARDAIMEYLQGKCPSPERPADEPLAITVETENVILDEEYCRAHLEAQPGQFVCLSVSDNGCGMDAETQARVFEPFFTTKEVGQGTGLGLAMVHGIVKGHDGFINLHSEPGVGTTLKVYLPRAGEQMVTETETETEPAALPTGSETILLAEDDEAVRNAGCRILESLGYTVLLAGDGREALQIYERERGRIDLALLDLTMPRMSGLETLRGILQLDPGARVILASGYSANGPGSAALAGGAAAFVQKPYDLQELAQAVRAVLDG